MKNKISRKIFSFLLVFFIILCASFLTLEILNLNKIVLGAQLANLKIGGLETDNAKKILRENFDKWENSEITLLYEGQKISAKPKDLGIRLDLDKTVSQAYNFGRDKNILVGLSRQISAILPLIGDNIAPAYSLDEKQFQQFTKETFILYENPAQNSTLAYEPKTKKWQATKEKAGMIFNRQKFKNDLNARIFSLNTSPIQLSLVNDQPEVSENETERAKERANQILSNAPYYLKYNDKTWPLDKETLLDWIVFIPIPDEASQNKILGVSLDQEKIKDILTVVAPYINQEPVNAQLTTENGKVTAFVLSHDGITLDIEKSAEIIEKAFNSADGLSPKNILENKNIELAVKKKLPRISTDSIDTLGLTSLIGKGESNFAGSPKNRTHNIKTGTAKFNGVIIAPNEEFSFNKILGEIGPEQGYLPELVIKNHKVIPEYGGGICQVSTTAFRAAINSGLKITERYPHAFPVKYYNPQGFDATIYPPHPDLRFINDTPKYILMQSKVEGTKVFFEFYGTNDGREVKIKGPTILQSNPDGSMKTILYQEIWRNGQLEKQNKFPSNYKSPALYPKEEKNPLE